MNQIAGARALTLKAGLRLELHGMRMSRGGRTAYAIVKDEFGFRGTKESVFQQLTAWCDTNLLGR